MAPPRDLIRDQYLGLGAGTLDDTGELTLTAKPHPVGYELVDVCWDARVSDVAVELKEVRVWGDVVPTDESVRLHPQLATMRGVPSRPHIDAGEQALEIVFRGPPGVRVLAVCLIDEERCHLLEAH